MATERYLIGPGLKDKLAEVIRRVDGGSNPGFSVNPVHEKLEDMPRPPGVHAREGIFESPWPINTFNTVRLTADTSVTVSVLNTLINYPSPPNGKNTSHCVIVRDGNTWFLANWQYETATAVFTGSTYSQSVVTDVQLSASFDTATCSVTLKKTVTTTAIMLMGSTYTSTFLRLV